MLPPKRLKKCTPRKNLKFSLKNKPAANQPMAPTKKEFYVIAHNIRSLLNVGSIFRTADAFGVTKIFLTGYTGTPANFVHKNKISKVALGAENFVPWEYNKSAVRMVKVLRSKYPNIAIIGLENNVGPAIGRPQPL